MSVLGLSMWVCLWLVCLWECLVGLSGGHVSGHALVYLACVWCPQFTLRTYALCNAGTSPRSHLMVCFHCFLATLCQLYLLQDTIIGLKALAAFSRHTFTPEINMTFRVETNAQTDNIMIVNENRYMRHEVMVRYTLPLPRLLCMTHPPLCLASNQGVRHSWFY